MSDSATHEFDKRSWYAPALSIGLVVVAVLPGFLVASLAVRIRQDFPFSDSLLGIAVGASYGVAALISPFVGRLVDRIGPKQSTVAGGSLAAASSAGIAAFADSASILIAFLTLAACANALSRPGASSLIAHTVNPAQRGLAFGVQQAAIPAAALLAGLALPFVAVPVGWRAVFVLVAILAAALVIANVSIVARAPLPAGGGARTGWRQLRNAQLVAVAATLASGASAGVVTFLIVFAVDAGMAEGQAGFLLAGTSLTAVATRVGLGLATYRRPEMGLTDAAAIVIVGVVGFLFLATAQTPAIVAGAVLAGGVGWGWTGLALFALVRANPEAPAATAGIMMVGIFAGAGGGPAIFGLLAGATSFTVAWLCGAVLAMAAAGVLVAVASGSGEREKGPGRGECD